MQPRKPKADQTMQILDFLRENIPGEGDAAESDNALNEAQRKLKKKKNRDETDSFEPGTMPQPTTGSY